MATFMNTTAINYHLEELIKRASERLILISPYLRISERLRILLEDKNRLKIDVRLIYGKNELQPDEINWIKSLEFLRLSYCKNLHAKCYLSESTAMVTSMNLYEFSQINNDEMGILIVREQDPELYKATYEEVQRLVRYSEEVKISVEKVVSAEKLGTPIPAAAATTAVEAEQDARGGDGKLLSATQLAKKLGKSQKDIVARFMAAGWVVRDGEAYQLTPKGKEQGAEMRKSQYGDYIAWPASIKIP